MQITVIERAQQIQIQEQEIIRRERELEATIRKPAEAEKYRLEKIADANRLVIICIRPYRPEQGMGRWVMDHGSNGSRKSDGSHGSWVTRC